MDTVGFDDRHADDRHTFDIEVKGQHIPVTFTGEVLEKFEQTDLGHMDRQIRELSDREFGPDFYLTRTNRLGVVAPILHEAVHENDQQRILVCVLWLAARFPEVCGIQVEDGGINFLWDEDAGDGDAPDVPKYLH